MKIPLVFFVPDDEIDSIYIVNSKLVWSMLSFGCQKFHHTHMQEFQIPERVYLKVPPSFIAYSYQNEHDTRPNSTAAKWSSQSCRHHTHTGRVAFICLLLKPSLLPISPFSLVYDDIMGIDAIIAHDLD